MATMPAPLVEDVWACCDNCDKWRRLPPGTVLNEKEKWYCRLSPDPLRDTCDAPEESYDKEAESSVYFEAGQVVKTVNPTIPAPQPSSHRLREYGGRSRSGSPAVTGRRSGAGKQRRSGVGDMWRHQSAGDAGTAGRGLGTVRKAHGGFQKIIQKGGVWDVSKGRGQAAVPPPHWLWDGLASFAPEAAQLANEGVNIATAASYFRGMPPNGEACANAALEASRLAMTAAAAMAAVTSGQFLESDRSARAASSAAALELSDPGRQQQQQQQQQVPMQPHSSQASAAAMAVQSAQPAFTPMPWLPQGLPPPWLSQAGMHSSQWQLPPASLAQLAAALAASAPGQMALGQQPPYGQVQLPSLGQQMLAEQALANGVPQAGNAGGMHGAQPAPMLLPNTDSAAAAASTMLHGLPHALATSIPMHAPIASGIAASAALQPAPLGGQVPAPSAMSVPALQHMPTASKQHPGITLANGRTHPAGS